LASRSASRLDDHGLDSCYPFLRYAPIILWLLNPVGPLVNASAPHLHPARLYIQSKKTFRSAAHFSKIWNHPSTQLLSNGNRGNSPFDNAARSWRWALTTTQRPV